MSGRLGNCTIGKRRGNESPVKCSDASQALSRRSLIINMPHGVVLYVGSLWNIVVDPNTGDLRGLGS